jgi:hypothetical protein
MKLRNFISSLLAGVGASSVHIALMAIKHRFGLLPQFEPYEELQRLLSSITSLSFEAPLSWLLPFINGAMVLGFVFGKLFTHLPGRTALAKGAGFGLAAWLVLGLGLFPLAGRGVFALELGLGVRPAALMLGMLMMYSIVMSLLYAWLAIPLRTKARGPH